MRLTPMLMLVLMRCAAVDASASSPAYGSEAEASGRLFRARTPSQKLAQELLPVPGLEQPAEEPAGLDGVAVRELLAGFELELGDERAKTAAATTRADLSEDREKGLRRAISEKDARAVFVPAVTGAAGVVVGVVMTLLLELVVHR